jgi:hypothetical protein
MKLDSYQNINPHLSNVVRVAHAKERRLVRHYFKKDVNVWIQTLKRNDVGKRYIDTLM